MKKTDIQFPRGYTPTLFLRLKQDVDFSIVAHKYFTIEQGHCLIQKADDDVIIDGRLIGAHFSQEETLRLRQGKATIKAQWTYAQYENESVNRGGLTHDYEIEILNNPIPEVLP